MFIDLPNDLPPACVFQAAADYQIPPSVLYAIRKAEGGTLGKSNRNTNGTRDYGPMQINTVWVNRFNRSEGLTADRIAGAPCIAVRSAAYVLRFEINQVDDFWLGVGNYHSHTPFRNESYRAKIYEYAVQFDTLMRQKGWLP
jgi:hypothetical protein